MLRNNSCYFTIINFIASFTAIAVAYVADSTDYYHISIPKFSYLSLILVAGIIEFLVVKAIVFKKISCSKKKEPNRLQFLRQYVLHTILLPPTYR